MIKIVWFVPQPAQDIEGFERWYQKTHAPIGMRQDFLQRFRIARAWLPQPDFVQQANGSVHPPVYRLPEGYWRTMDDIHACYRSVHALAAMGDAALNAVFPPATRAPQPVLFVTEKEMPAAGALCFDPASGAYASPETTKLWGFVQFKPGAESDFDARYAGLSERAAGIPLLQRHVLGACQEEAVVLGRASQWPPVGAEHFDRTIEYYFDRPADIEPFAQSEFMDGLQALLGGAAEHVLWVAVRIQETFFTNEGEQPLEDGWQQLALELESAQVTADTGVVT